MAAGMPSVHEDTVIVAAGTGAVHRITQAIALHCPSRVAVLQDAKPQVKLVSLFGMHGVWHALGFPLLHLSDCMAYH